MVICVTLIEKKIIPAKNHLRAVQEKKKTDKSVFSCSTSQFPGLEPNLFTIFQPFGDKRWGLLGKPVFSLPVLGEFSRLFRNSAR